MKNKLAKVLLAAGMIFTLPASTTFAAEIDSDADEETKIEVLEEKKSENIHIPIKRAEVEPPEFLVKGVVKDLTQKILPVSLEARFFAPRTDIAFKSDNYHYNGGDIHLKSDLGFGNDNAPELIFRYRNFTADYFKVHGSGSNFFTGNEVLRMGDYNYVGNVNSDSNLHYLKLQVTNPVVKALGSGVDWSYGLTGIRWERSSSGFIAGTAISDSSSKTINSVMPTVGIGAHASILDTLIFNVHLSGMALGKDRNLYDFEAGVRYNPIDLLSISVGYRKIHAKLKKGGETETFDLNGPYAGLRFDF